MTTQTANSTPETGAAELAIAGVSPQMLACLLVGTILFGVVVGGAYIFTRRVVGPVATVAAPVVPATPIQPASAPAPAPAAPFVIQSQPLSLTITAAETSGRTFLQVGAIERGAAPRYIQDLADQGFSPRIAEGPTAESVRILIGPLTGTALPETAARLAAAGVVSFPKTY
ncbi:MAG TPA: hypothetical protein VGK29_11260 [Paludibaculum sp.]